MSVKANRVFRFCAWWTLLASIIIGILLLFPAANVGTQSLPGLIISVFFGIVGMIGSITSLLLLVGMFAHLLKVSGFSASSKAIWATIFILVLPVGEVIYFFAVYVRNRAAVLKQAV
jgi:hypothetical protein